jgi:hypothetical protein
MIFVESAYAEHAETNDTALLIIARGNCADHRAERTIVRAKSSADFTD